MRHLLVSSDSSIRAAFGVMRPSAGWAASGKNTPALSRRLPPVQRLAHQPRKELLGVDAHLLSASKRGLHVVGGHLVEDVLGKSHLLRGPSAVLRFGNRPSAEQQQRACEAIISTSFCFIPGCLSNCLTASGLRCSAGNDPINMLCICASRGSMHGGRAGELAWIRSSSYLWAASHKFEHLLCIPQRFRRAAVEPMQGRVAAQSASRNLHRRPDHRRDEKIATGPCVL